LFQKSLCRLVGRRNQISRVGLRADVQTLHFLKARKDFLPGGLTDLVSEFTKIELHRCASLFYSVDRLDSSLGLPGGGKLVCFAIGTKCSHFVGLNR